MTSDQQALDVAVLTCGPDGIDIATRLARMREVRSVMVVTAPYTRRRRSALGKLRVVLRHEGVPGVVRALLRRLHRIARGPSLRDDIEAAIHAAAERMPTRLRHLHVADLHSDACVTALREFRPTLGVALGTYILRPCIFEIPSLGTINLHCGKAPQYRGSAAAFWELYNGEGEVGITIHWINSALDAGDIIRQETFPLDCAPSEDPLRYIDQYRRDVLAPNGVRLVLDAVAQIAAGDNAGSPQDPTHAVTYPTPDYKAVRQLQRRVRERRRLQGHP